MPALVTALKHKIDVSTGAQTGRGRARGKRGRLLQSRDCGAERARKPRHRGLHPWAIKKPGRGFRNFGWDLRQYEQLHQQQLRQQAHSPRVCSTHFRQLKAFLLNLMALLLVSATIEKGLGTSIENREPHTEGLVSPTAATPGDFAQAPRRVSDRRHEGAQLGD